MGFFNVRHPSLEQLQENYLAAIMKLRGVYVMEAGAMGYRGMTMVEWECLLVMEKLLVPTEKTQNNP